MEREAFPPGVAEHLKWYVYRLIDPRNGETFYVGKGKGNRIFAHVRGALAVANGEDAADLKVQTIKEIRAAGLSVAHVVHRHGIEEESVAYLVEAALIDAYPAAATKVAGHGSDEFGCRHVEEIITEYAAEPFVAAEPLILIFIGNTFKDERIDPLQAVSAAWKIDVKKAREYRLVLAHRGGLVVGAFRPTDWLQGTLENFPWMPAAVPQRWGFKGDWAEPATASLYMGKRVPDKYRGQQPVRYIEVVSTDYAAPGRPS